MKNTFEEGLRRYELLMAHSQDIILFVRGGDGLILETNAAATKAYGFSREELLKMTIHDLRATDAKSLTADQMDKANTQGILFDTVHRRKDGSTFPAEVSSQGATIDGTSTFISIIRDITQRRRVEAKIISLARYPAENPNPILRVNNVGTLLYANKPAYTMMESMGWREGLPLPESLLIPIRDALKGGQYQESELTCQREKVWALTLLPNVRERHVTLYALDITVQKKIRQELIESEERFRKLADAMPQLVWTAAPDGTVDYFNYRLREFKLFKGITPVIHPKDLQLTIEAWQYGVKTGKNYEIEHRMQRADDSFRWFLTRAVPIRDATGCVIRWYGTSTDVDDRKQAEQALQQAKNELEDKVRERTAELLSLMEDLEKRRR